VLSIRFSCEPNAYAVVSSACSTKLQV
jgi:hypothetical protein